MGQLLASINLTLDGCCDHREVIADDDLHDYATDLLDHAAALLFGRVTYELFRAHWPTVAAAGSASPAQVRFARALEGKRKYLVSRHPALPGWNTSLVSVGGNGGSIRILKEEEAGALLVPGSPSLIRALAQWGLIDEYHLAIQPILAGHGPIFLAGLEPPVRLKLLETRSLASGVAIHRYAAGS
jgi:dihydrofolate reductase